MLENQKAFGKPILWGLLPSDLEDEGGLSEEVRRELEAGRAEYGRFREHYVSRLIDRFGEQLDEIRKKEGSDLKESRLQVLISSIANGADTFTSTHPEINNSGATTKEGNIWETKDGALGEREMVLEGLEGGSSSATGAASGTAVVGGGGAGAEQEDPNEGNDADMDE